MVSLYKQREVRLLVVFEKSHGTSFIDEEVPETGGIFKQ